VAPGPETDSELNGSHLVNLASRPYLASAMPGMNDQGDGHSAGCLKVRHPAVLLCRFALPLFSGTSADDFVERGQQQRDVSYPSRMAHQTDAPTLTGQLAEPATDLDAVLVQQP
jgi:hypothetical protein